MSQTLNPITPNDRKIDSARLGSSSIISSMKEVKQHDKFALVDVRDDSLTGDGIEPADTLIIRITFDAGDLTQGKLVAVNTPAGFLVKHLYRTMTNKARLVSSNKNFPDMVYGLNEVLIHGIVVGKVHDLDS